MPKRRSPPEPAIPPSCLARTKSVDSLADRMKSKPGATDLWKQLVSEAAELRRSKGPGSGLLVCCAGLVCCAEPAPRSLLVDLRGGAPLVANSNGTQPCNNEAPDGICPPLVPQGSWDACPFPGKADVARVNEAYVVLQVSVAPTGTAESVTILRDPGYDFGQFAAMCAFVHKYIPAHYADGRTVGGKLQFRIHFSRPSP
jgi:hypothetical protein